MIDRITSQQLSRIQHIHQLGFYYREQMDAGAVELCKMLGVDPDTESSDRDLVYEIIDHGRSPRDILQILGVRV